MAHTRHLILQLLSGAFFAAASVTVRADELPVPCSAGTCGPNGPATWITSGAATANFAGNTLTINQSTDDVVLNWQSFNISADGTVRFRQPSAGAVALNQIFQADPSRIFGALNADGRVFLLNQNGIIFGEGAVVDVGGLLASSLQITPEAIANGIAGAISDVNAPGSPAFRLYDNGVASAPIVIGSGASIVTAEGGQVLVFAPIIEQRGDIATPGGQTMLAAGTTVYLAVSNEENLRGLLVEIDAADALSSTVTNGAPDGEALASAVGQIVAERGNVTLAGLAVNQNGRVTATTSVRQNGSIRLQARTGQLALIGTAVAQRGNRGGRLTLGEGSSTDVTLVDDAEDTTVDVNTQPRSRVELVGAQIELLENSRVTAVGGDILVKAQADQASTTFGSGPDTGTPPGADDSRIYVAPGAVLDVSGASVDLPMERNVLRVELRGNQLRDSPAQRDGELRGEAVYVDIRRSGTREDGTVWQGTPLADVQGDISTIARSAAERNLRGGNVVLQSQGDLIMAAGALIDVSGGVASYADGFIDTTQLLAANGSVVDIGDADPDREYVRTVSEYVRRHERWGVTEMFAGFPSLSPGTFEHGYVEGYDAGSVTVVTPRAILDGDVLGSAQAGFYQREPTADLPDGARRPYTQVPRGASFVLGRRREGAPEFVSDPIVFVDAGSILPTLLNDAGQPFDPRVDMLPQSFDTMTVRTELFGPGRIAEAGLHSADSIRLAADQSVELPPGGELNLVAPRIELNGTIDVPAGTLTATAERSLTELTNNEPSSLVIGPAARLTARGAWVNDDERSRPDAQHPSALLIDGGTIRLSSTAGDLRLVPGSIVDVSGGAYRPAAGSVVGGAGGTIGLATQPTPDIAAGDRGIPVALELGAELRAYALFDGGTLDVTAGEICVSSAACAGTSDYVLNLAPQMFAQGGFARYALRSNRDSLRVEGPTPVLLRQQNLVLAADSVFRPSASSILDFARIVALDDLLRRPSDLSLRVIAPDPAVAYDETSFLSAPMLRIARGSRIEADPGAAIEMQANTRVAMDGTIVAPAGNVAIVLDETLAVGEFIDAQTIRLGDGAMVDLRGAALIAPNASGARRGTVLDGGTLTLDANRGYIVTSAGARIDVSGTSGMLDMRTEANDVGLTPVRIGSSAGAISLRAAEGIVLGGEMLAQPGEGSSVAGLRPAGGTLRVVLDPTGRNDTDYNFSQPSLFPLGARTITLAKDRQPLVIGPNTPVPAALNGRARISTDAVAAGGFDALVLEAWLLRGRTTGFADVEMPGTIAVEGNVSLSLPASLAIEAARFNVAGGHASLAAPYVTLGNTDRSWTTALTPVAGTGSLSVAAGFLELTGRHVIDGAANVELASAGDLRLRGIELPESEALVGSLATAGNLTLSAAQVYPSTLSDFEIAVRENPSGVLTIAGNGAEPKDVLSAASTLRLAAPSIVQAGVLRAPFGTIEMTGDDVSLRPGSTTSTSAEGLIVPFGTTQGGFAWVYDLERRDFVYGVDALAPPSQSVVLQGRSVDIESGATIDLSGGGDLLAYEFIPGVGGSRDVLSASVRPDEFAIVPSLDIDIAPFDQREYVGSPLRPGDSVFLEAGAGLPAGEYVLLPARYALLPGAFLVRAVGGYLDAVSGERFARLDGSTVVAGYRTLAGTGIATSGTRLSGFAVRRAELALREAEYTTSLASAYFAGEAVAKGLPAPRLPQDGGVLALNATETLLIDGLLRAEAADGGRGAAVDISATRLRVTDGGGAATPGEVVIDAASLGRLGAESLLLGGRRSQSAGVTQIDVTAEQVTIAAGTALESPELLLAARATVLVDAGASLTGVPSAQGPAASQGAGNTASERYALAGDAALLRVAGGRQAEIERSGGSGLAGTIDVREAATLDAGNGAILLDATADTRLLGDLALAGGSLNLGASRITLGNEGVVASGLVLTTEDLADLAIAELVLTSRSAVDVSGDVTIELERLVVDAAGLRGIDGGSASIDVIDTIRLMNAAGVIDAPIAGGGSLTLRANAFELGRGDFALTGFASAALTSTGATTFEDGAALTATGDLEWRGAYLTGLSGARGTLGADGKLSLAHADLPAGVATGLALGARLDVTAARIEHDGTIALPGGTVAFRAIGVSDPLAPASGSLALGENAVIDVAGQTRVFDGVAVAAPGGRVELSSANADVGIASGAVVDVSGAAEGGDAGSVEISAGRGNVVIEGTLSGHSLDGRGGALAVDAESFGGYAAVADQADAGGFTEAFHLRQRGAGDIVLAGESLRARDVEIVAEQGSVRVGNLIDASGETGGRVRLAASDSVAVSGAITAAARGDGARGGTVELLAENGGVRLGASASVDVAGGSNGAGGTVHVRLPAENMLATLLDADASNDDLVLAGVFGGARSITIEGYRAYDELDGVLGGEDLAADSTNVRYADAEAFMASEAAMLAALGRAGDPELRILPGLEIRAEGDLTLSDNWNLYTWRFADRPGVLTLRAGGDLLFDGSLSDGFTEIAGTNGFALPTATTFESWRYRLVGGANATSADPLGVRDLLTAPPLGAGEGDVRLAGGTDSTPRMIRTGTGSIEIAAANDFVLGNQYSVVYTAGVSGPGIRFGTGGNSLGSRAYPVDGGDIAITAGRDIRGAQTNQFVNDWLWRVGSASPPSAVAWTVNFERFQQNVGALGGGDVRIGAGGDITDFSVSLPSIGRQVGGTTLASSVVEVVGGGRLDVDAGGSILGGSYYVGRGNADVRAGDAVGAYTRPTGTNSLAPLFGLGDSELELTARTDLVVEAIANPQLMPHGLSQWPPRGNRRLSYYSTYSEASAARLVSVAGDLFLVDDPGSVIDELSSMLFVGGANAAATDRLSLRIAPPTLRAAALSGDVVLEGTLALFPAPKGNLEIFAQENVRRAAAKFGESPVLLALSDAPLAQLPSIVAPQSTTVTLSLLSREAVPLNLRPFLNSPVPVHSDANQSDGMSDLAYARIIAANGDIDLPTRDISDSSSLFFAKPVRIIAGRDVIDLALQVQHLRDTDISVLQAGRDVRYTAARNSFGQLLPNSRAIFVDGPGLLQIAAGRDVDLQTSQGIVTRGNFDNRFLPAGGASVSVIAGLGNIGAPDYAAFVERYLGADTEYADELIVYVERMTGASGLTLGDARERFVALDESQQRRLVEQVFVAELRAAGREAAKSGNRDDFEPGFEALETLFPGSNPDTENGESNALAGDVRLFFSRLYTLAGGDISVFAPGGDINVGLATPPIAFGVGKAASELGMVAQQTGSVTALAYNDFLVNESRVFAADGGDILVWTTEGDIDAGRGAKTAISAPPPTVAIDENGQTTVLFPAALTGSGIQTLATTPGREPGNVDLFAPRGVVNAGDAGIVAGNLTIAATAVLGADNISVSGVSVGVPVDTGGFAAALSGVSAVAASASNTAEQTVAPGRDAQEDSTPLADAALGFLEVFITGFGDGTDGTDDEECDPNDPQCQG